MNNKNFETYQYRQPNVVIQKDVCGAYCKDTYFIWWRRVSERFGIFRIEPLKDNVGKNRRQIMNIIKAAYPGLKLRSFDETLEFCRSVGIYIGYYDRSGKLTYLAE